MYAIAHRLQQGAVKGSLVYSKNNYLGLRHGGAREIGVSNKVLHFLKVLVIF